MGANNNAKLDDQLFALLALEITQDFPDLTLADIEKAILNGIKGRYNDESYVGINFITIYRWIEKMVPGYRKDLEKYGI